ncbi:MAG: type I-E CRISPR-associated protein Cse2/CasB [Candidatus Omnitrophota bacterium]
MSGFIAWLEKLNAEGRKAKAVLRRSLAFAPGTYIPAYPYVEPFLKGEEKPWKREMFYLVAGLWAAHWREGRTGPPLTIGKACTAYAPDKETSKYKSTERRFITLLDSDTDQFAYRLRQMMALLKEQSIDYELLLTGLLDWNDDRKRTQNAWARDFYQDTSNKTELNTQEK